MTEKFEKPSNQTNLNCENVSQQIQIEKQEFKCIINLNTTFCANKSKRSRKRCRKHRPRHSEGHGKTGEQKNEEAYTKDEHEKKDAPQKEREHNRKEVQGNKGECKSEKLILNPSTNQRMVPTCSRRACWDRQERRKEKYRRNNLQIQNNIHRDWNRRSSSKDEAKHEQKSKHHHHHKCKHYRHKIKQTESRILLSPISSTPLEDAEDNLTYEDISSTSLEVHIEEKPTVNRRPRKPPKHCYYNKRHRNKREMQESKLDTLIRRTKERERKLVEQSRCDYKPWFTSTPIRNEYSSLDFPMSCSNMDISFNSLSTYVLENKAYSPSCPIEDLQTSENDDRLSFRTYSPGSPTGKYHTLKVPKETYYKAWNVKKERTVDIESSPTSTPEMNRTDNEVKGENLVKTEPFSCAISPIYFENETTGLQFCKTENMKSEFNDHVDYA